jgi:hypothetical protein
MEYIQAIDFDALRLSRERWKQSLLAAGVTNNCTIDVIKTPSGAGSPAGLHPISTFVVPLKM